MRKILFISLLELFVLSCAVGPRTYPETKLVYKSAATRPSWITKLPISDDFFYATGFATNIPSLEDAKRQATSSAVVEVVDYMGLRASVQYTERKTELVTKVLNEISTESAAQLIKTRISELYYEQYRDVLGNKSISTYDVYVLLRIPTVELAKEKDRLAQEKAAQKALAMDAIATAQQALPQGAFNQALHQYLTATEIAIQLGDIPLKTEAVRNAGRAINQLAFTIREIKVDSLVFPKKFTIHVHLLENSKEIPLVGVPLRLGFLKGSGSLDQRTVTDTAGVAEFLIHRIDRPAQRNIIEVKVDDEEFSPWLQKKPPAFRETIREMLNLLSTRRGIYNFPLSPDQTLGASIPPSPSSTLPLNLSYLPAVGAEGEIRLSIKPSHTLYKTGENILVAVKIDMTSPAINSSSSPPLNIALVMDRSGSMGDEKKLEFTKKAAHVLVDNLDRNDSFTLVTFDSNIEVVSPITAVNNRLLIKDRIEEITAGGTTNLSGGLFEGYAQVTKAIRPESINRIILLSDGIANEGITTEQELIRYARDYAKNGVSISSVGVGKDYNEDLLLSMAEYSNGNYYYVKHPEDIPLVFSRELNGLLAVVAQNIRVEMRVSPGAELVTTYGAILESRLNNRFNSEEMMELFNFSLGDLISGRSKILIVGIKPPYSERGRVSLVDINISYDDLLERRRIEHQQIITVETTRDERQAENSIDPEVMAYAKLFELSDVILLACKSLEQGLYNKAREILSNEYSKIEYYAKSVDNPELLERIVFLKPHIKHLSKLAAAGKLHDHSAIKGLRKELQYNSYLLRHRDHLSEQEEHK